MLLTMSHVPPRPNLPKGRVAKRQPILYEFFEVSQLVRSISNSSVSSAPSVGAGLWRRCLGFVFPDSWRGFYGGEFTFSNYPPGRAELKWASTGAGISSFRAI